MRFSEIFPRYLQLSHHAQNLQRPIGTDGAHGDEKVLDIDSWDHFDKFINDTLKEWHAPGIAVALINGNETEGRGYGLASLNPPKPVTNTTLFYTGSTTKSFTAAALSLLIDDKDSYPDLDWSTTIKSLIPEEFVTQDEYATNHLTIEDFLTHRSGYPRHEASWPGKTLRGIIENFRYLPQSTEMRTKFQYCNLGFMTLSYIIEKLTNQWLGTFFTERLWKPMGMESTYLSLKDALNSKNDLAHGYFYNNDTSELIEVPWVDSLEISGAGLTISNVLDYAQYIRVMMHQEGPISKKGHQALRTPRVIMDLMGVDVWNGPMLYSLGWMQSNYHGERLFFHGGALDGFYAHMAYLPDRNWGLVTMLNMASPAQNIIIYHLLDEFLGIPADQRKNISEIARKSEEEAREAQKVIPDLIYPNVPSPPLPPSLPLNNYTGTYYHPAYFNLTLYQNCPIDTLSKDCEAPLESSWFPDGKTMKFALVLKHISADFFLATANSPWHGNDTLEAEVVKAKFEVDSNGVSNKFGLDIRMEGLGVPLVWFDRVA